MIKPELVMARKTDNKPKRHDKEWAKAEKHKNDMAEMGQALLRNAPRQCRSKQCKYNRSNPIDFSQECIGCGYNRYASEKYVKRIQRAKQ